MKGGVIEEPVQLDLPERMNASTDFLDANLEAGRGDAVAIHYAADGSTRTYAEVAAAAARAGNALLQLGLELEQRVMLLLLDTPEFPATFFGAIRAGLVPVPTNTMLTPDDYRYLLQDSRARALVVSAPLLEQIEPVLKDLRFLRHLVVASDPEGAPEGGAAGATLPMPDVPDTVAVHRLDEITAAASPELAPVILSKDDPCFWLYSSGTTGFPKGTVHLQHDMLVCCQTYARHVLGLNAADTTYSVAKLFFAYGLGNALYFPFHVGASTVLHPGRPTPEVVFDVLREYRPTVFYSVPTGYGSLLAHPDPPDPELLSDLRICVSAGEALPKALLERWQDRYGVPILDGIGSTEVLQMFISNRPDDVTPGSTGRIVPGYAARVVDEHGHDVPRGEVGDLLVKGDSTCAYYWNRHEETKETILGHWIRTGDKYRVDEDGRFWYQGRSDDMLKVGGIWVSPFEVESALMEHPDVLEAAVVGAEDDDRLVKPKAFVVLEDNRPDEAMAGELQSWVKERLAPYKYPRWIEFVESLPKTATGKIQRYRLR